MKIKTAVSTNCFVSPLNRTTAKEPSEIKPPSVSENELPQGADNLLSILNRFSLLRFCSQVHIKLKHLLVLSVASFRLDGLLLGHNNIIRISSKNASLHSSVLWTALTRD